MFLGLEQPFRLSYKRLLFGVLATEQTANYLESFHYIFLFKGQDGKSSLNVLLHTLLMQNIYKYKYHACIFLP